jgi:hypothetical protein
MNETHGSYIFGSALIKLNLSENLFTSFPAISNGSKIISLNLSHNKIADVEKVAVDTMPNIQSLDLSNNQIKTLNLSIFDKLTKLISLILTQNNLEVIGPGSFPQMNGKGSEILLNRNKLTRIDAQTFKNSTRVTVIDLSGNKISSIDSKAFDACNMLTKLNLSDNQLTNIADIRFRGLHYLDISNNSVSYFDIEVLPSTIKRVYLRGNLLKRIDNVEMAPERFMDGEDKCIDFDGWYANCDKVAEILNTLYQNRFKTSCSGQKKIKMSPDCIDSADYVRNLYFGSTAILVVLVVQWIIFYFFGSVSTKEVEIEAITGEVVEPPETIEITNLPAPDIADDDFSFDFDTENLYSGI